MATESYYNDLYHETYSSDGTVTYTSPLYGESYSSTGVYTYTSNLYGESFSSDGTTSYYNTTYNEVHHSDGRVSYTDSYGKTYTSEPYSAPTSDYTSYYDSYTPTYTTTTSYTTGGYSYSTSSSSSSYTTTKAPAKPYRPMTKGQKTLLSIGAGVAALFFVFIGVLTYFAGSCKYTAVPTELGTAKITARAYEFANVKIKPSANAGYKYAYGYAEFVSTFSEKDYMGSVILGERFSCPGSVNSAKFRPVFVPEDQTGITFLLGEKDVVYEGSSYFLSGPDAYSSGLNKVTFINLKSYLEQNSGGKSSYVMKISLDIAELTEVQEGDYAGEKFNNTRQVIRFQHIKDNGDYTRYGGWTLDYGEDEIVTSFGNYSFVTEPSKIEYLSDYMCFAFGIDRDYDVYTPSVATCWQYKNFKVEITFAD